MNKKMLEQRLIAENIPSDSYSLDGGLQYDRICLSRINRFCWEVYYTERGEKYDIKRFFSEEKACEYFYNWLTRILKLEGRI